METPAVFLLKLALTLLLAVQSNPNVTPELRNTAINLANQAITVSLQEQAKEHTQTQPSVAPEAVLEATEASTHTRASCDGIIHANPWRECVESSVDGEGYDTGNESYGGISL